MEKINGQSTEAVDAVDQLELEALNKQLHHKHLRDVYKLKMCLFKRLRTGRKGPTWIILGPQGAGKSRFCSSIYRTSNGKSSDQAWDIFHSLCKPVTVTKLTTTFEAEICETMHQFIDVIGIKSYKDLKALLKVFKEEYLNQDDIAEWADETQANAIAIDKNLDDIRQAASMTVPEAEIYFDGVIMVLPANHDINSESMKASIDLIRTLGDLTYPYPIAVVITFAKTNPEGVQPIRDRVQGIVDKNCIFEIENYDTDSKWSDSQDFILRSILNSLLHQSHKLNNSVLEDTFYNRFIMYLGMIAFKFQKGQRKTTALTRYSSFPALAFIMFLLSIIVVLLL